MANYVDFLMPLYGVTTLSDDSGNFAFRADLPSTVLYGTRGVSSIEVTIRLTGLSNPSYANWLISESPSTPNEISVLANQSNLLNVVLPTLPGGFSTVTVSGGQYIPFVPWGITLFKAVLPAAVSYYGPGSYDSTTPIALGYGTLWTFRFSVQPMSRGWAIDRDLLSPLNRYWASVRFNFVESDIPPLRLNQRTDGLGIQGHSRQNQQRSSSHGESENSGTRLGGHNTYV